MTDQDKINDYDRLKREYTLLHEDYRRLAGVSNLLDLNKIGQKLDEVLDNETSKKLKEWLHSKRL